MSEARRFNQTWLWFAPIDHADVCEQERSARAFPFNSENYQLSVPPLPFFRSSLDLRAYVFKWFIGSPLSPAPVLAWSRNSFMQWVVCPMRERGACPDCRLIGGFVGFAAPERRSTRRHAVLLTWHYVSNTVMYYNNIGFRTVYIYIYISFMYTHVLR